jgi:hypothetical protein
MRSKRADEFLRSGEFWKAKKILQGRLTQKLGFDHELLEQFGEVLLQMEDQVEAGRYLFASGVRKPANDEAIAIFLSQKSGNSPEQLWSAMPSMLRASPEIAKEIVVGSQFSKSGFDEKIFEKLRVKASGIGAAFPEPKQTFFCASSQFF